MTGERGTLEAGPACSCLTQGPLRPAGMLLPRSSRGGVSGLWPGERYSLQEGLTIMLKSPGMRASALGLVLAAAAVGAAGAQEPEPRYLTLGLLTVGAGEALGFHVSFDDHSQEPPAIVQLNLFDQEGTLVRSRVVTLAPGQSATLLLRAAGKYRAQAVVFGSPVNPSGRREVVGCAEMSIDDFTTVNRIVCQRLPDKDIPG